MRLQIAIEVLSCLFIASASALLILYIFLQMNSGILAHNDALKHVQCSLLSSVTDYIATCYQCHIGFARGC